MTAEAEALPIELGGGISAEVRIGGQSVDPLAAPPPCEHRTVMQEVTYAVIADGDGATAGRQLKVKAQCAECGVPFRFFPESAHASLADGELGCVIELGPVKE